MRSSAALMLSDEYTDLTFHVLGDHGPTVEGMS